MVETFYGPWYYPAPKASPETGVQIDLLIDRKDTTINICEIKFSKNVLTIDSDYSKKLRQKVEVFKNITKTRKNIFLTMVTTFGITNNSWSNDAVSNSITKDSFF